MNSNSPNHYQLIDKDKKSSTELEMTAAKTKIESQIRSKTVELKKDLFKNDRLIKASLF